MIHLFLSNWTEQIKIPVISSADKRWGKVSSSKLFVWNGMELSLQSRQALWDPMDYSPPGSSVHEDSPGKNTGEGCHALLQGIFPTQGSNPGRPHCRQVLDHQSHQGSPRILEWVSMPSSRGSFQPRDQRQVSHIAGRFFTSWATREAHDAETCFQIFRKRITIISVYADTYR